MSRVRTSSPAPNLDSDLRTARELSSRLLLRPATTLVPTAFRAICLLSLCPSALCFPHWALSESGSSAPGQRERQSARCRCAAEGLWSARWGLRSRHDTRPSRSCQEVASTATSARQATNSGWRFSDSIRAKAKPSRTVCSRAPTSMSYRTSRWSDRNWMGAARTDR